MDLRVNEPIPLQKPDKRNFYIESESSGYHLGRVGFLANEVRNLHAIHRCKAQNSSIRMFSSEDLYRIEYLQERKVIIGSQKLNKLFVLDLNSKSYTEKPYRHWATSARLTITTTKRPSKPEPLPYPFVPFDPSLFEIPAGFVKAK